MMPPMVGVPALALCQVGPSSRISWPAFSLCSSGMRNLPMSSVSTKLTAAAIKVCVMCLSLSSTGHSPGALVRGCGRRARTPGGHLPAR